MVTHIDESILAVDDERDVIRCINKFFAAIDTKQYAVARALLTDTVHFDYSKDGMGMPSDASELVQQTADAFAAYGSVQHTTLNHVVSGSGDCAEVHANYIAYCTAPGSQNPVWWMGGRYHLILTRTKGTWQITANTKYPSWNEGGPISP